LDITWTLILHRIQGSIEKRLENQENTLLYILPSHKNLLLGHI
jgi:hypothetical protein